LSTCAPGALLVGEPEPVPVSHAVDERAVLDSLPRAVVVTDPHGRILLWNRAAERLFGWPEREVAGRSVLDVLAPPDDLAANRESLLLVAAGKTLAGDRLVVRRDGSPLLIRTFTQPVRGPEGEVVAIAGSSEDVGDVRLRERQASELGEHLRLALDAGGLGTWRWDSASGKTMWDERLEALFGLPPGGFDGTYDMWISLLHPDDRDTVLTTVEAAVSSRSSYRVEHRVVWPDGSIHWIAGAGGVTLDERGRVTGTVGCSADVTDRVTQELERRRLAAIAVLAADQERVQRERLEFLVAINDALNSATTVQEVMVRVTRRAVPRLGDWCSIHVVSRRDSVVPDVEIAHVDPAMVALARELQEQFPYDPDAPTGVAHVIRTGETVFYPDITDEVVASLDTTQEARQVIERLALRSAIVVPMVKRGRVLGAMQFVMSSSSRRYTEDDVALARAVAGRIASSLENLRLHDQQRLIAQTLQRSLLPASLPDIPGVEVAVRYWPVGEATEAGGDFFDVFALETADQWAVVIGDVCGTGPEAAALTALARHTIRDSAWHGDSPVAVLGALNRAVRRSGSDSFLTAVYAVLDTSGPRPQLTVTCGGHPLPVLTGRGGAATIGLPGTLLGVLEEAPVHPATVALTAGDVVVFYTDGATDIPPPHALDEAALTAIVEQAVASGGTAEDVAERMRDALEQVESFERREDDIALLVLRVADRATLTP
jgi:PAS domain S-box-containing protein